MTLQLIEFPVSVIVWYNNGSIELYCMFPLQAAVMSMAYKEGISFPPAALNKVIVAANQDVRQVWLQLTLQSLTILNNGCLVFLN